MATHSGSIWADRNYVWWLAGDTSGMIGRVFSLLIVSFVVYDLTGSEGSAGTLQTIILVLMLIASIPGGVIVDRLDRRALISIYSVLAALASAAVFAFIFSGGLTYLVFALLMSGLALIHGFFGEATNASLRSIVSGGDFVKAQAANQGRDAAVQLLARPLSGFLYGLFAWLPYLLSAVFCAVQGFVFTRVKTSLVPSREGVPLSVGALRDDSSAGAAVAGEAPEPRSSMRRDFAEGLRYLTGRRTLLILALIITLINLGLAGLQSMMTLSLIARGYPAVEVGYLGVAVGLGIILASTVAGRLASRCPTGRITVLSLVWFTLSVLPLLASDGYWVMMGCSFALGLCVPITNSALLGYLLGRTPEHFQGRVSSILNLAAQALSAFAPLVAGVLLEVHSFRLVAAVFIGISAASAVIAVLSRRVRGIPAPADWESYD